MSTLSYKMRYKPGDIVKIADFETLKKENPYEDDMELLRAMANSWMKITYADGENEKVFYDAEFIDEKLRYLFPGEFGMHEREIKRKYGCTIEISNKLFEI